MSVCFYHSTFHFIFLLLSFFLFFSNFIYFLFLFFIHRFSSQLYFFLFFISLFISILLHYIFLFPTKLTIRILTEETEMKNCTTTAVKVLRLLMFQQIIIFRTFRTCQECRECSLDLIPYHLHLRT